MGPFAPLAFSDEANNAQTHEAAIVFVRQDDWASEIVSGNDIRLELPELGFQVPFEEIYVNSGVSDMPGDESPG